MHMSSRKSSSFGNKVCIYHSLMRLLLEENPCVLVSQGFENNMHVLITAFHGKIMYLYKLMQSMNSQVNI